MVPELAGRLFQGGAGEDAGVVAEAVQLPVLRDRARDQGLAVCLLRDVCADEQRLTALVARIKAHPGYTEAIGQDLDIIGAEQTLDTTNAKPALKLELQAGHPNVKWTKGGFDALEIWVDRGTGTFVYLATDTIPDYLDTAPLPAPGQSALWKYKAIYRLSDQQVGQWSDVVSIAVHG